MGTFVENVNTLAVQLTGSNVLNIQTVVNNAAAITTVSTNIVDVQSVATDMLDITAVASDLTNVNNVATSIASVSTVASNVAPINTVATNIVDVVSIADTIVPNIAEILLADTNASIATTQAAIATTKASEATTSATDSQLKVWEAEARKMTADSYATEPENVFVKSYTSDGDGIFTATDTTEYSALHWAAKALVHVTDGVIDDATVSTIKVWSSDKVNDELLLKANISDVADQISALVNSSPAALDTLNELAAALGNDANFATTITTALSGKQATITGAATTIDTENLTASMAMVSDSSGKVAVHDTVTATELGYLDGVTAAIQHQLNAKQATLVSDINIKTINGTTILGSGDLNISTMLGNYSAGPYTEIEDNDEESFSVSSFTKAKEIKVSRGGVITVYFGLHAYSTSVSAYAKIYVNGIANGTLRSVIQSTAYTYFTENITVNAGDLVQLYVYSSISSAPAYCHKFRIKVANPAVGGYA